MNASVNFSPCDNSNDQEKLDTLDFASHFPGWSPLIESRAVILLLRIENNSNNEHLNC